MCNTCKCGCNTIIPKLDNKGRPRSYVMGHGNSKRIGSWNIPKNKKCNKCLKLLAIKNFYIKTYTSKSNNTKYTRYRSQCKLCDKKTQQLRKDYNNAYQRTRRKNARINMDLPVYLSNKLSSYRRRSKQLQIPFNLTKEYLIELFKQQNKLCFYTKIELILSLVHCAPNNISLDRKYPPKGYVKGNVVWCSYRANTMKGNLDIDEFYSLLQNIINNK